MQRHSVWANLAVYPRLRIRAIFPATIGWVLVVGATALGQPCEWDPRIGIPGMTDSDADDIIVRALTVYDDGNARSLYAGGIFTRSGSTEINGIAKWTGEVWTPVGGGVRDFSRIYAMVVVEEGIDPGLYVGGSFTIAGLRQAKGVARWDGNEWRNLGIGLEDGIFQTIVFALAIYDDGNGPALYAGGRFRTAGGAPVKNIAKWNGSIWSGVGGGMDGMTGVDRINALHVFDDGSGPALYAGGMFDGAGGVPSAGVVKWDGETWSDVGGGVGGNNPYVRAFEVYDDGNGPALIVGGNFTSAGAGELTTIRVAKWDGVEWSAMGDGFGGINPWVTSFKVFDDRTGPQLFACGKFTMSGETVVKKIARWTRTAWVPLRDGVNDNIYGVTVFNNEDVRTLTVGGRFIFADHQSSKHVAQWSCPEPLPGDTDSDGDVDLIDYRNFTRCIRGPGQTPMPACMVLDLDEDFDVDWSDFGRFQSAFTGSSE